MFLIDTLILAAGVLIGLGALASKLSARLGLPGLVVFLLIGMGVGTDGLGVEFDNYQAAHAIGTVALGLILFDGGLRTPLASFKLVWAPAGVLATFGVLITSLVTGVAAAWILDRPLLEGLLLGAIVGSTDAAAVFSLLRSAGVRVERRVAALLEVESGSNDPMAIFLTIGLLEVLTHQSTLGWDLLLLFVQQMGIGAAAGVLGGKLAVKLINRSQLGTAGLYPILTGACGAVAFGVAANLGGSGFLAAYLAGIIIGNSRIVFQNGTLRFFDGLAWGSQISMFLVLGLLVTPRHLVPVIGSGLLISCVLIFIARPLSVFPLLRPFGFNFRETLLVSWVGLKGAVPIILATFPLLFGLESGALVFNVVFFVVGVSAVVQGTTLPWVARLLRLDLPPEPQSPVTLELASLFDTDAEIVEYVVKADDPVVGVHLRDLDLPEGAIVAMIIRDRKLVPPRGSTLIQAGDYVSLVLHRDCRAQVDRLFLQSFPMIGGQQDRP